jgi:hypothetical protein
MKSPSSGCRGIMASLAMKKLISFARQASATLPLGPEPVLGIPTRLARQAIKNWTKHQHFITWTKMPGCKHGKLFMGRPCKKRAEDLLKLGRHQLKMVVAILTGHAPVQGHLRTTGLFDGDPSCRLCEMETKQCSISSAAARRCLASATMFLGSQLSNQKI